MTTAAARPDPKRLPAGALAVLEFWFGASDDPAWGEDRRAWFVKDDGFDAQIRARFGPVIDAALRGTLADWTTPWGELAHIIVLDQFTRNVFRGEPRAFAGDARALALAQRLVASNGDTRFPPVPRSFAYLPFEHAEDLAMQDESVRLFAANAALHPEGPRNLDYAQRHRAIVARFGRFPHRNAALGRASTDEEVEFLKQPGSGF